MFVLGVVGYAVHASDRLTKAEANAQNANDTADAVEERMQNVERDFADYKEKAAREYVTRDAIASVMDAINRLADRLDRVIERLAGPKE